MNSLQLKSSLADIIDKLKWSSRIVQAGIHRPIGLFVADFSPLRYDSSVK